MTFCEIVPELGVYTSQPCGRPTLCTEETRRVRAQKTNNSQQPRRVADKAAQVAGVGPPTRKRGRPPMYTSPQEAVVGRQPSTKCAASL